MTGQPQQQTQPQYRYGWMWVQSDPQKGPGRVRIFENANPNTGWDVHIAAFDEWAQKYLSDRVAKIGQPVTMPDGTQKIIPYNVIDDASDNYLVTGPNPSRGNFMVRFQDGTTMEMTTDFWENSLIPAHLSRKKAEPDIPMDFGSGAVINVSFENFDAMCKDFMRRRGDFISAGWWPELIHKDHGQFEKGPKPVEGRANALGQGVQVQQGAGAGPGQPPPVAAQPGVGPSQHPGLDNEGMV